MSRPLRPTAEQRAAARLRVVLDRRLGRTTPDWVTRLATADPSDDTPDRGWASGSAGSSFVTGGYPVDPAPWPGDDTWSALADAPAMARPAEPELTDADVAEAAPAQSVPAEFEPVEFEPAEEESAEFDERATDVPPSDPVLRERWFASRGGRDTGEPAVDWSAGPADAGWSAARELSQQSPELTEAGLPRRVPRQQLVPGSVREEHRAEPGNEPRENPPAAAAPTRSADAARDRMAGLQRGTERGRREVRFFRPDAEPGIQGDPQNQEPDEPPTPGD